jgi:hypothetical protein
MERLSDGALNGMERLSMVLSKMERLIGLALGGTLRSLRALLLICYRR